MEVVITTFIVSLSALGISAVLLQNMKLMYSATFHSAAMTSCMEKVEQLRAEPFNNLVPSADYNDTDIVLTHTYSPDRVDILCNRTVTIEDLPATSEEDRKVTITVEWIFQERTGSETVSTILYK